jgi:hypothetical protein
MDPGSLEPVMRRRFAPTGRLTWRDGATRDGVSKPHCAALALPALSRWKVVGSKARKQRKHKENGTFPLNFLFANVGASSVEKLCFVTPRCVRRFPAPFLLASIRRSTAGIISDSRNSASKNRLRASDVALKFDFDDGP